MILFVPGQLKATEKQLDYKLFLASNPKQVRQLLNGLQSIAFRMQALEIAHQQLRPHPSERQNPLGPLGDQLREGLQQVFEKWSRCENAEALEEEKRALEQISKDLDHHLGAGMQKHGQDQRADETSQDLYALLGSLRGLVRTIAQTQKTLKTFNWSQWTVARF